MARKFIQTKATTTTYGISDSSTTIQLKELLKLDGTSLSASDIGDLLYGTFSPGTSREEIFSIVGANVTIETNGNVTITNITRGLQEVSPYSTGGYSCDHPAGEVVVFGNNPQLYDAIYDYIDAAVIAGAVPATDAVPGIVIEATQAQVDAGTTQETYNAQNYDLFARPDTIRAKKYHDYVADTGTTDAYAITVVPAITAYSEGQEFTVKANTANTGACTLNVCALGAKDLKKAGTISIGGDSTTQFDITNPSGSTFRYTYDGTGTDPSISATTIPVGTKLIISGQNFTAGNNGTFTVTASGSNYFEVTNASGVVESNKTVGTGYIYNTVKDLETGDIEAGQIFKVVVDAAGKMQMTSKSPLSVVPIVRTYTTVSTEIGSSTTRFDISNPSGTTFRYTWDSTGTDPGLSLANNPVGSLINFQAQNFTAANNGVFIVTGAGSNYVEVTNASGVVELDKTIGTGYVVKSGTTTWSKPAGLKYVIVKVQGAGGGGGGTTTSGQFGAGGGGGGYAEKLISSANLLSTQYFFIGAGGTGGPGTGGNGTAGRLSAFSFGSSIIYATGGELGPSPGSPGGAGGQGFNGDINCGGGAGGWGDSTGTAVGFGGGAVLGPGGAPAASDNTGRAGASYGGGGGGGRSSGGDTPGGAGGQGIVIITEYY